MKNMTIREAVAKLAFTLHAEYDFYLYALTPDEEMEEMAEVEAAQKVLSDNHIPSNAASKHAARWSNVEPEPVRFIDRQHFKAVESDELPF